MTEVNDFIRQVGSYTHTGLTLCNIPLYNHKATKGLLLLFCYFGPPCQRQMSVVRQQRLNLLANISLHVAAVGQMAAERESDKMVSDIVLCMKKRCETEFLLVEKMEPTDIHHHLQNVYGAQRVDVSTVRQ